MEDADAGEVAVLALVVHAVADDEFVFDFEAYVVGLDGGGAAGLFVEEDDGAEGLGLEVVDEAVAHAGEGEAGVEDVVDEQDVFGLGLEGEGLGDF